MLKYATNAAFVVLFDERHLDAIKCFASAKPELLASVERWRSARVSEK